MTNTAGVLGYAINPNTGALAPLSQGLVPSGEGFAQWVAADPSGTYLYVSAPSDNAHGNQIGKDQLLGYRIDAATGNLTPVPGSPLTLSTNAGQIVSHPNGKFLYMSERTGAAAYAIDSSTGRLTPLSGSPFVLLGNADVNLGGIAIDPAGRFLYEGVNITTQPFHTGLVVAALDGTTGKVTPVAGSPFNRTAVLFPSVMMTDAAGNFLFTGAAANGPNLEVDAVAQSGQLNQAGNPYATSDHVFSIAADPKGPFVYVEAGLGGINSGLFAFREDASGTLTPVPGSPFGASLGVGGLVVDQNGKFLYGGSGQGPLVFAIDANSGALTPLAGNPQIQGTPFGNAVVAVAY